MATMPLDTWVKYKNLLAKISDEAAKEFRDAVFNVNGRFGGVGLGQIDREELIQFAYALVTKYSEASTEAACIFYDELAELSGAVVPPAVPAETANISTVAKAVKFSDNEDLVSSALCRLVKQASQDTTLQNALRDGAEFAWIPAGDTCAFCLTLASRGWQTASKGAIKNGHAEHIHGNCDCAYAVRFNEKTKYAGYDPDKYLAMYNSTSGTPNQKINAMRRKAYAENKEEINAQKRSAYEKRKELNSSEAEEINVN
jgi:hypothetical protein